MVFVPSTDPFEVPGPPDLTRPLGSPRDVQARPGMVRIAPANERVTSEAVIVIQTDVPDRSGGVGGWETVERRFQRPAKYWRGPELSTLTLHCAIDRRAIRQRMSVERALEQLYALAKDPSAKLTGSGATGGAADDPTPVRLTGDVVDRDQRIDWVIQDITLAERLPEPGHGFFVLGRQHFDLELEEYVAVPSIDPVRIGRTRDKAGQRAKHTISTKQGDTLRVIALRELGEPDDWTKVRDWNPKLKKVHPDDPLATGTKVVIGGKAK